MKTKKNLLESKDVKGEMGFTLIETLLSLLIFTVGILAVMTMTSNGLSAYSRSRTSTAEVNRTCINLEVLKEARYENSDVFKDTETTPTGNDGATVSYNNTDDAVVAGTKLIVMQNNAIKGGSGSDGTYALYFTKPFVIK